MLDLLVYAALFATAFGAATILPLQSEAALLGLLLTETYSPWLLIAVASLGNVGGAVVNWMLGRGIERFRGRRWFPVTQASLDRAQAWYARYGRWSLLLSWVPIIGDPITLAAGLMRERLAWFLPLVAVAKIGRYLAVAALALA